MKLCPTCGQADPGATIAEYNANAERFKAVHERVFCPGCRKQVSITMDAVAFEVDLARFRCPRCTTTFDVAVELP